MTPVRAVAAKPQGSATIEPKGQIHIGKCLLLEQSAATAAPWSTMYAAGLPEDGRIPAFENPMPFQRPGELPRTELKYSLRKTDTNLDIQDKGLTSSYGIFGAPGSGKTVLLLYLLRQLLALEAGNDARKFGCLILDPKAALIEDVRRMAAECGRSDDLVVINLGEMEANDESVNVIDVDLKPNELARALVLAAQSAGTAASEPYWFGSWQNLFTAAIHLLNWQGDTVPTLAELLQSMLTFEDTDALLSAEPMQRPIERMAVEARAKLASLPMDERAEARAAINQILEFYSKRSDGKEIATVGNLIQTAYSEFLWSRTRRFSRRIPKTSDHKPIYDQIIDEGKIVLVSVSTAEPGFAKVLCTLVKNLFMQSVRSRLDRVRTKRLQNFERPILLACDEYSQVASEIPGQVGDGDFFSIARQQGCMGLVATQSVNVLQSSSLKENWKSIFSNFSAKIFMRAVDNETTEQATKLVGETEWLTTSLGTSSGGQGLSSSEQRDIKERKVLPAHILTQLIRTGQGVAIGSLDGGGDSGSHFFHVPRA